MDKKNVSMNDVAVAAGVSLKTVSRVINEPDSVRESTRDKVHAAMEMLGFRANFAARSLKLGRYGCIGVVLFHLSGGAVDMIDGIADAAEERQGHADDERAGARHHEEDQNAALRSR